MSVLGDELRRGLGQYPPLSEEEIDTLQDMKLLVPRRDAKGSADCYWFSHPYVGLFVHRILQGRKAIIQCVKMSKYRELSEIELEKRLMEGTSRGVEKRITSPLPGAGYKRKRSGVSAHETLRAAASSKESSILAYPFKFHLIDVIGSDALIRVSTPSIDGRRSFMVRIRTK